MRRLTIYFFYDPDGIVDGFVLDCVAAMAEHSEHVLVVSNGELRGDARAQLSADERVEVVERPNEGFDVWAYKYAIDVLGWEQLRGFDEVVFMNFTIAGPLHPLAEMFDAMASRELDFWGLSAHAGGEPDPWGLIPSGRIERHLQSHFIAVRRRMLQSPEFQQYWDTMRPVSRYEEAIAYHEVVFTGTFESLGFSWDSYVDGSDLANLTAAPLTFMPRETLIDRRSPFFKRKGLFLGFGELGQDHLAAAQGRVSADTFACLEQLGYDTGRIIPNIIRTTNQYDIRLAFNAAQVVSQSDRPAEPMAPVRVLARVPDLVSCQALERHLEVLEHCAELVIAVGDEQRERLLHRLAGRGATLLADASFATFLREVVRLSDTDEHLLILGFAGDFSAHTALTKFAFHETALRALAGSEAVLGASVQALAANELFGALTPATPNMLPETPQRSWEFVREVMAQIVSIAGIHVPLSGDKPAWGPPSGVLLAKPGILGGVDWQALLPALAGLGDAGGERVFNALIPFILQARGELLGFAIPELMNQSTFTILDYLLAGALGRSAVLEQVLGKAFANARAVGIDPNSWLA